MSCVLLVHAIYMTCWLVHDLFTTCSLLVQDFSYHAHGLLMTQIENNLFITSSWLAHKLLITHSSLVHYFFVSYPLHVHDLHMVCSWLAHDLAVSTCTWLVCYLLMTCQWYRAIKKTRKNSLTQQNDHTSVNFLAIWLKFFIKVDETCTKLLYFISHPSKTLIKLWNFSICVCWVFKNDNALS